MTNVKAQYTTVEWKDREQYYIDALSEIVIPDDLNTQNIQSIGAMIDKVNSAIRLDIIYAERTFEALNNARKAIEKELFLVIKSSNVPGVKTVDEVNGAVTAALKVIPSVDALNNNVINSMKPAIINAISNAISPNVQPPVQAQTTVQATTEDGDGTQTTTQAPVKKPANSILQVLRLYEDRLIFLKRAIEILDCKHGRLITGLGSIKLEANLTNLGGLA